MSLPRVQAPRIDGGSYIISRLDGEILTLPGSQGAFRLHATQKQTDNAFAIFNWDGPVQDQGFHYHKKTHDCFMITEGYLKVYCGDDCKILSPGDFASVPPGLLHKPTPMGPITKVVPLVSPAEWVDFFRDRSEPFSGLMFPEWDKRNLREEMLARMTDGFEDKYDTYLVKVTDPAEPSDWTEKNQVLPEGVVGYYLRYNTGPRWILGGVSSRPFITTKQSNGRFAISCIESSSAYASSVFGQKLTFAVHHAFLLLDGLLDITIGDEEPTTAHAGEIIFIGARTPFAIEFRDKYTRFWSYQSGDGIDAVIHEAGSRYEAQALPDKALEVDQSKVEAALENVGIKK